MSLRDLGVFEPLKADHPLVEQRRNCWICDGPIIAGMRTALVPFQTPEEAGSHTVEASVVCGTCHLRGKTIRTPIGLRVVLHVMRGGYEPELPTVVVTTDLREWRDEEVGP